MSAVTVRMLCVCGGRSVPFLVQMYVSVDGPVLVVSQVRVKFDPSSTTPESLLEIQGTLGTTERQPKQESRTKKTMKQIEQYWHIYGLSRASLIMVVHPGCPVCSIVAASLVAVETNVGETISAAKVAFVCGVWSVGFVAPHSAGPFSNFCVHQLLFH